MFNKLSARARSEKGFTLIELLVVILIIGILAAIALPAFLGQRVKGQDSSAKSDARNLVSTMESCFTETENYTACDDGAVAEAGLDPAAVSVAAADAETYTVTATSKSGNLFYIDHNNDGTTTRRCDEVNGKGGCGADGSW